MVKIIQNKGVRISKLTLSIFVILLSIIFLYSVWAAITVTVSGGPTFFNFNEDDATAVYNITINNSNASPNGISNITQVNITLQGAVYLGRTNATSAQNNVFTNTTATLVYTNETSLISATMNFTQFWFNASAATPGYYNVTITVQNTTAAYTTNITIRINDTTPPFEVNFSSGTETNLVNNTKTDIPVNITGLDNGVIQTIVVLLYNSTGLVNRSTSTSSPYFLNFTSLRDGTYYFNGTVNDTYGNSNTTARRQIMIDTTSPTSPSSFSCTPSSVASGATVTCSCSGSTDATSGINVSYGTSGYSFTGSPSTATEGTFKVTCTARDYLGNENNANTTYTVTASGSGGGSGGGGGGGASAWTTTYTISQEQFTDKEGYTQSLGVKGRISFKVQDKNHHIGVKELTTTTAKIEIASTPVEATLLVGDEKRFDLTNDGYYDVLVKLNSITNNAARIMIKSISEKITQAVQQKQEQEQVTAEEIAKEEPTLSPIPASSTGKTAWIIVTIVLIIIALAILFFIKRKASK